MAFPFPVAALPFTPRRPLAAAAAGGGASTTSQLSESAVLSSVSEMIEVTPFWAVPWCAKVESCYRTHTRTPTKKHAEEIPVCTERLRAQNRTGIAEHHNWAPRPTGEQLADHHTGKKRRQPIVHCRKSRIIHTAYKDYRLCHHRKAYLSHVNTHKLAAPSPTTLQRCHLWQGCLLLIDTNKNPTSLRRVKSRNERTDSSERSTRPNAKTDNPTQKS